MNDTIVKASMNDTIVKASMNDTIVKVLMNDTSRLCFEVLLSNGGD